MKKLILVSGPAAIGKSTFSKRYRESNPRENVLIISADEMRKQMYGGYDKFPPNNNMMLVYGAMTELAKEYAKNNEDVTVIFDTTMLYDERRLFFRRELEGYFDHYALILLRLHNYQECLERNRRRPKEKFVPENVITDMIAHYEDPSPFTIAQFDSFENVYADLPKN